MRLFKRMRLSIRAGLQKAAAVWSTTQAYVAGFWNRSLGSGKATYGWLSENGFKKNPIANRAIRLIGGRTAKIEIRVFGLDEEGKPVEDADHPAAALLENPNPRSGRMLWFVSLISYLYLSGNVFVRAQRRQTGSEGRGEPLALWLLHPDRVERIRNLNDPMMPVTTYRYTTRRGTTQDFPAEEVRHIRTFNPDDEEWGYPLLGPAVDAIEEMIQASRHNRTLLANKGRHPGFFTTPHELGPDAFKRMKKELQDAYKEDRMEDIPGLLEGDVEFAPQGQSNRDLDYMEGKKQSRSDIAITAGVDPALVGDSANKTYSNFETAIKALLLLTVLPLLDFILDELNPWLFGLYGEEGSKFYAYNEDDIPEIQEGLTEKYTRLTAANGGPFISPDEARRETGFSARGGAFDEVYRTFNQIPIEGLAEAELAKEERDRRSKAFAALRGLAPGEIEELLAVVLSDGGSGDGRLGDPPTL